MNNQEKSAMIVFRQSTTGPVSPEERSGTKFVHLSTGKLNAIDLVLLLGTEFSQTKRTQIEGGKRCREQIGANARGTCWDDNLCLKQRSSPFMGLAEHSTALRAQ